jgi:hypothetical protein
LKRNIFSGLSELAPPQLQWIYDRDDRLPERVELMQFWADKIDALRDDQISVQLTMTDRRA